MKRRTYTFNNLAAIMERLSEICKLIWIAGLLAVSFCVFPPATAIIGIYFV